MGLSDNDFNDFINIISCKLRKVQIVLIIFIKESVIKIINLLVPIFDLTQVQ